MERYRRLGVIGALALLALVVVSVATAASPREIYADYADNGRLDRTYSDSDLRNALNDAAVQGYGKPIVTEGVRGEIQGQLAEDDEPRTGHGGKDGRLAALHRCRPGAPQRRRRSSPPARLGPQALRAPAPVDVAD